MALPDPLRRSFDRGLEAAFAADSLAQLSDAVDFEALAAGDPDAMDFERMGELVGQMSGRLVVKRTVGQFTPGQFAEQTVGYAIGGAIGREGGRLIVHVLEDQRGEPVEVEIEVEDEDENRELGDDEFGIDLDGGDGDGDSDDGGVDIDVEDEDDGSVDIDIDEDEDDDPFDDDR
jgi:hypothetical protein